MAAGLARGAPLKLYAYEVLQHLQAAEFESFLQGAARQLQGKVVLFLGSIPDRGKLRAFYDTAERWTLYEQNLARG